MYEINLNFLKSKKEKKMDDNEISTNPPWSQVEQWAHHHLKQNNQAKQIS